MQSKLATFSYVIAKLDKKRKNKMEDLPPKRPRRSVMISENDSKVLDERKFSDKF